ncbi:uncharacterized protein LOC129732711 [Wyeomyia smithii]|uniref:uncharacterized protein LOC129732711 n=1 Tax=Wyeomyia smithii TaxID=174621 RepID=UPI00246811CF|nr:uncharacterized protein LOC129732711 [Wyeomyia smithii]
MLLLWLLLCCALQLMWRDMTTTNGASYEVKIDSFVPDPNYDRTSVTLNTIRVTRRGRNNYVISGDAELFQNWGNENLVKYDISNSKGVPMIRGSQPFCELFNSNNYFALKIRNASTIPPGKYCPLPKGRYEIVNFQVEDGELPLIAVKDTYTADARMTAPDGHMVLAYKINFSII